MDPRGKFYRPFLTLAFFAATTLAVCLLRWSAFAAPEKRPAQDNVVISRFRTRGPGGGLDEFVEIFNPGSMPIDIGNWKILKSAGCPSSTTTELAAIPSGTILQPGQHYLIVKAVSAGTATPALVVTADKYYPDAGTPDSSTYGIADNAGIALLNDLGQIVDQVGMCTTAYYRENTPLGAMSANSDQNYERKPGDASGNCYDSDNNAFDFSLVGTSNPQNLLSPLTVCSAATATPTFTSSPTASYTPSLTPTPSETTTPTDTGTPTDTPTATGSPTPSGTPTDTPTATATPTPTSTPTATLSSLPPKHLVISEFRSRGPGGTDDEFVELYNPTGGAVNIGSWTIRRSSSCGTSTYTLVTITSGTILQPGQHFLAAASASGITGADQTFSAALADDGGVALVNTSGTIIDQAGACQTTQYHEATALPPLSGLANQSYERKPGGNTSCYDTDNNAADFDLITPSNPQNKASPIMMCAGVSLYTPTSTASITRTRTATFTPTFVPGDVAINEFLPHPGTDWNADGKTDVFDEYIELINMSALSINVKNWKLDNGIGGSSTPYKLPDITLLPRQIIRIFRSEGGPALSDGGSTVRLLRSDGRTADLFNYPVVTAIDQTWCRLPDGSGAWAFVCRPTPGRLNERLGPGTGNATGGVVHETVCTLRDAIPAVIREPECNRIGAGILDASREKEIWFEGRRKWDAFVE